jgi:transporter family-2 protein
LRYLILPLIALAGTGIPVQVAMNHRLEKVFQSPALATTLSFLIGAFALALVTVSGVLGRGNLLKAPAAPWWAWGGGMLSAFAVIVSIIGLPRAGAGGVIAATVFGQLIFAVVLDHFGWLDVPRIPINAWRIAGVVLLFAGALLMRHE